MKNAASLRAKLLALSKSKNIAFQLIIFRFLHESEIKTDQLHLAISTTFDNRKLSPGKIIELEDEKYIYDRNLNTRWKLFLSNNNITLNKDFSEIIQYIISKIKLIY